MFDIARVSITWGGRKLTLETGRIARQADGAVFVTYGETTVLAAAVSICCSGERVSPRATPALMQ